MPRRRYYILLSALDVFVASCSLNTSPPEEKASSDASSKALSLSSSDSSTVASTSDVATLSAAAASSGPVQPTYEEAPLPAAAPATVAPRVRHAHHLARASASSSSAVLQAAGSGGDDSHLLAAMVDGGAAAGLSGDASASAAAPGAALDVAAAPDSAVPPSDSVPLLSATFATPAADGAAQPHQATADTVDDPAVPSESVRLGDLDLTRPEDVAKAYQRIRVAAVRVCPYNASQWVKDTSKACVLDAMSRAVAAAGAPLLTAYLADRGPQASRQVQLARTSGPAIPAPGVDSAADVTDTASPASSAEPAAAASSPATQDVIASESADMPSRHVRLSDLDLSKPADVATAYKRLHRAAMQLCATGSVTYWACVHDSTGAAVSKLGSPLLEAYFQDGGRFGTASSMLQASAGGTTAAVLDTTPRAAAPEAAVPDSAAPMAPAATATDARKSAVARSDQDLPRRAVTLADLDLTKPEDVAKAYRRIHFAATQVCPDADAADLWVRYSAKACVDSVVSRAVSQLRSPLLTAYLADLRPHAVAGEEKSVEPPVRIVLSQ
jgi:UrcA family protein